MKDLNKATTEKEINEMPLSLICTHLEAEKVHVTFQPVAPELIPFRTQAWDYYQEAPLILTPSLPLGRHTASWEEHFPSDYLTSTTSCLNSHFLRSASCLILIT